jgi:hypothetical protein
LGMLLQWPALQRPPDAIFLKLLLLMWSMCALLTSRWQSSCTCPASALHTTTLRLFSEYTERCYGKNIGSTTDSPCFYQVCLYDGFGKNSACIVVCSVDYTVRHVLPWLNFLSLFHGEFVLKRIMVNLWSTFLIVFEWISFFLPLLLNFVFLIYFASFHAY